MALDQDTSRAQCLTPRTKTFPARADVVFYKGAIVCKRRGSKYVEIPDSGSPRTDLIPIGICTAKVDSTGLSDGDVSVCVEAGAYRDFVTGSGDNEVTSDMVGETVYMYDDETLYATDNGGTLSPAGELVFVDANDHDSSTQLTVYFDWEQMDLRSAVAAIGEALKFDDATELTIDTGEVTVTQSNHTIDTEADASSDNLDTISGSVANTLYLIKPASAARTVVIRHAQDNIYCPHGKNISLAEATDWALLVSDGTDLTVLAASTLAQDGSDAGAMIGLLASLTTTDKSSVVAAINELDTSVSAGMTASKKTVTVGHADLTEAVNNTSQAINIGSSLPSNARIVGVDMRTLTPFTGGSVSAVTCDVGTSGDVDALIDGADLQTSAVDGGPATMPKGIRPNKTFAAGGQLIATFYPDSGHALDALTAGSVVIDVLYIVLA